ncbi:MAG TPA: helix-hairpin-helix domain-containing protein [Candidatus Kapabacteria bacterium]|nr:helix-hairpin-helix domain-containing protein [Candidatus Kapabacteria bacterium]
MSPRDWVRTSYTAANKFAQQLYTPRELKAIVLFLLLGIVVLLYRSGSHLYFLWFPSQRSANEVAERKQQDSLYFALSAVANVRDSLFFSLPEDSLLPTAVLRRREHHSKTDDLRPASISLNNGTREDFERLPSVGPASAELICKYRSQRGSFRSLEEIRNVHGFGAVRFEKIKRYLRLD